jgi:hypothetical protein
MKGVGRELECAFSKSFSMRVKRRRRTADGVISGEFCASFKARIFREPRRRQPRRSAEVEEILEDTLCDPATLVASEIATVDTKDDGKRRMGDGVSETSTPTSGSEYAEAPTPMGEKIDELLVSMFDELFSEVPTQDGPSSGEDSRSSSTPPTTPHEQIQEAFPTVGARTTCCSDPTPLGRAQVTAGTGQVVTGRELIPFGSDDALVVRSQGQTLFDMVCQHSAQRYARELAGSNCSRDVLHRFLSAELRKEILKSSLPTVPSPGHPVCDPSRFCLCCHRRTVNVARVPGLCVVLDSVEDQVKCRCTFEPLCCTCAVQSCLFQMLQREEEATRSCLCRCFKCSRWYCFFELHRVLNDGIVYKQLNPRGKRSCTIPRGHVGVLANVFEPRPARALIHKST